MSHYDVLGVAPAADDAAIRRAYVALARRHHPDVAGGDAATMRVLNAAFAVLGDPARRARYDTSLAVAHAPKAALRVDAEQGDGDDVDGLLADLEDDRPVHAIVVPRWVSLLPATLLVAAALTFLVALRFASRSLLGLAMVDLMLSLLFFIAAPFLALFASRSGGGGRGSSQ